MASTQQHVQAATKPAQYSTKIVFNRMTFETPHAFTLGGTTYMPLYYVHNVLYALGLHDKWNGKSWDITGSGLSSVNLFIKSRSGTVNITLNGKLVEQNVPRAVAVDPDSGSATTYVPIWYIQQLLNVLGVTNTWDSSSSQKTWTLSYHKKLILVGHVGYAPDGTLYAFAPDGVYRYAGSGWILVPGSDSIGVIKDGVVRSDGSIIVLGESDMWQFANGGWSQIESPQLDSNSLVLDYNKNTDIPLTIAGTVGDGDGVLQYQNQQWTIKGIMVGINNRPLRLITKPDGSIIYETKGNGIWEYAKGQWAELPWFTSDGSERCYALTLSPDGVLTGVTGDTAKEGFLHTQVWQFVNGSWSPIGSAVYDHLTYLSWQNGTLTGVGGSSWQYVDGKWSRLAQLPSSYEAFDSDSKGDFAFAWDDDTFSAWNNGSWTTFSSQIIG